VRRAALVLAALLAGCALAPAPPAPASGPPPPLTAYAANPFVPVNLYLNANQHVGGQQAALIEHAARSLADSKAFVRVDRGVQRWPITLQANYRVTPSGAPADTWRRVAGALTLGLVPVRVMKTHALSVEVFEEPDSVATLELSVSRPDRVSLWDLSDPDRDERAAVDALLERLLAEIASRRLVPRWSAFAPEPKKKVQPPRVPGRET
jgi:hypothetical protein